MNGNYKYTLSDEQRNLLANKLDNKVTSRLVSRKDMKDLLDGFLRGLTATLEETPSVSIPSKEKPVERLTGASRGKLYYTRKAELEKEGKSRDYILAWTKGWDSVS